MNGSQNGSKTAKLAYRPFGMAAGIASGLLAGIVFKQVWKRVQSEDEAPGPLKSESPWTEVLLAAAVQGAIFAVVKAAVDRAGASAFERLTGEWPGD